MKQLLLFLLLPVFCLGQGDQTIIKVPIDNSGTTEQAILHLPDDYGKTTTSYPIMIFLHGVGEGGTNPASIYNSSSAGGPSYFITQGKFPSSFVNPADKQSYKYIVLSPQNNQGWSTTAPELDLVLTYMIQHYRINQSRVYLTGLSAGGEGIVEYVGQVLGTNVPVTTTHKIAAFIPMSAVMNGALEAGYATKIVAGNIGLWGFGSPADTHGANTLSLCWYVNNDKANAAISTSYSGGHCCWGQFYDPNYRLNGKSIYEWALQYTQGVSAPPSTPPSVPAGNPVAIPGKVEGEGYSAMSGVATETTADAGGGLDVGWIDKGDYMDYSVNVASAGQYSVGFRVATPNAGASFQLTKTDGTVLATVNVPNTGGYQTWQTVTVTVTLPAGIQTLRMKSVAAPPWNINWMQFSSTTPAGTAIPGKVEADSYSAMSGVQTQSTSDAGGGLNVGWINKGDWMEYGVNVASAGVYTVSFRVASLNTAAVFQLLSNGSALTTVNVPNTGGYQSWQTVTATVSLAAGQQKLRILSTSAWQFNINWMQFAQGVGSITIPGKIEAENYSAMSGVTKQATTDAGGGSNVGWIDKGDWMDYSVNVSSAGQYTCGFRVATPYTGATLQLLSNGTVLATVKPSSTGNYQTWQTFSATVTLPAGQQTLRVVSTASNDFNLNWIQINKAGTTAAEGTEVSGRAVMMSDSVATASGSGLRLYPNPVHDQFTISLNNDQTGRMLVQIVDGVGSVKATYNFSKTSTFAQENISVAGLSAGIYFVRIQVGNKLEVKKIVKL